MTSKRGVSLFGDLLPETSDRSMLASLMKEVLAAPVTTVTTTTTSPMPTPVYEEVEVEHEYKEKKMKHLTTVTLQIRHYDGYRVDEDIIDGPYLEGEDLELVDFNVVSTYDTSTPISKDEPSTIFNADADAWLKGT